MPLCTLPHVMGRGIENCRAQKVFRQFVDMPWQIEYDGKAFTVKWRFLDIWKAIAVRQLDGLIHYTKPICYRQIYDILLRANLKGPIASPGTGLVYFSVAVDS